MSNESAGQIVLSVAGAAIGAYFGGIQGAAAGYQIGLLVGGIVDPYVAKSSGPKITDNATMGSTYGAIAPLVFGQYRVSGNVIWMSQGRDVKVKVRTGKGGVSTQVTNFQRKIDFAVEVAGVEIVGVSKIFADAVLVADMSSGADLNAIVQSQRIADSVILYPGSNTQLPDPTIEAVRGIGNTPAYRGRAYLMFKGWDTTNQGGRLQQISTVLTASGSVAAAGLIATVNSGPPFDNYKRIVSAGGELVVVPNTNAEGYASVAYTVSLDGLRITPIARDDPAWIAEVFPADVTPGDDCVLATPVPAPGIAPWYFANNSAGYHVGSPDFYRPTYGVYSVGEWINGAPVPGIDAWVGSDWLMGIAGSGDGTHIVGVFSSVDPSIAGFNMYRWSLIRVTEEGFEVVREGTIEDAALIWQGWGCVSGREAYCASFLEEDLLHLWCVSTLGPIRAFEIDGEGVMRQVVNVTWPHTAFDVVSVYAKAGTCWAVSNNYFAAVARMPVTTASPATLEQVILATCAAAGYLSGEVDASEASSVAVTGYSISGASTARSVIEQLQVVFSFDLIESGEQLVVRMRGRDVVATIPYDDLGASLDRDEFADRVAAEDADEETLPRVVNFTFASPQADYQPGLTTDMRQGVSTQQIVNVSVPVALTMDQAQQVATKNLEAPYAARVNRTIKVTSKYLRLEPSDVIRVLDSDAIYIGRIVSTTYDQGIVEILFVDEQPAVWIQTRPGPAPGQSQTMPALASPTILALYDPPALLDSDATSYGIVAAAAGVGDVWPGAVLYRSEDGGDTFDQDDVVTAEAAIAVANTALGEAPVVGSLDLTNFVDVTMIAGNFESCSHAELREGANLIAIGNEILQFRDVQDLGGQKRRLRTFRRGLRTEFWASQAALAGPPASYRISKGFYGLDVSGADALGHYPGEYVSALTKTSTTRLAATASESRTVIVERGVTTGQPVSDARDTKVRFRGRSRLALPPQHLYGHFTPGGDLALAWRRRSRIDGDLRDGADVPFDFGTERYWVQLNDGPVVKAATTAVTVTAASLTSLGLSSPITFRVAQIPDEGESAIDVYDSDPEVWSPALEIHS